LAHYRRANDKPDFPCEYAGSVYRADSAAPTGNPGTWAWVDPSDRAYWPEGISFFQGSYGAPAAPGHLEAVFSVRSAASDTSGAILHTGWYDGREGVWREWELEATFRIAKGKTVVHAVTGVTGAPAVIPSTYGKFGDFQLLVPQGPVLGHYRRANDKPGLPWEYMGSAYRAESAVRREKVVYQDPGLWGWVDPTERAHWPEAVSFFQGNYGTPGHLESVFSVRSSPGDTNAVRGARLFTGWYEPAKRAWRHSEIEATYPAYGKKTEPPAISGVTEPRTAG
jgi:hypothetical protein